MRLMCARKFKSSILFIDSIYVDFFYPLLVFLHEGFPSKPTVDCLEKRRVDISFTTTIICGPKGTRGD